MAHQQTPEESQPGNRAFDDPSTPVSPELSTILSRRSDPVAAMGTDQLNLLGGKMPPQLVAVVSAISDQALRLHSGPAGSSSGDGDGR